MVDSLKSGTIYGYRRENYESFQGIPYARSPIGILRFVVRRIDFNILMRIRTYMYFISLRTPTLYNQQNKFLPSVSSRSAKENYLFMNINLIIL